MAGDIDGHLVEGAGVCHELMGLEQEVMLVGRKGEDGGSKEGLIGDKDRGFQLLLDGFF
jgi:hypothetical protein